MADAGGHAEGSSLRPDETETERADRNLNELLGELRVALPGVQVLFAFLLTVPFSPRFGQVTQFQKDVYFVTLLLSGAASVFLIAPTAHHRVQFRQGDKDYLVRVANRFALAGLIALALAMTGVILLITDVLFNPNVTVVATAGTGLGFLVLWFAVPIRRRLTRSRRGS